jgi:hypothetical protein
MVWCVGIYIIELVAYASQCRVAADMQQRWSSALTYKVPHSRTVCSGLKSFTRQPLHGVTNNTHLLYVLSRLLLLLLLLLWLLYSQDAKSESLEVRLAGGRRSRTGSEA